MNPLSFGWGFSAGMAATIAVYWAGAALGSWLRARTLRRSRPLGADLASNVRVQLAITGASHALDAVADLTPKERRDALMALTAFTAASHFTQGQAKGE